MCNAGGELKYVYTTGIAFFAECLRHSAKAILHSAKPLPSVTLDKYFIGKGFFAEYFFSDTRQRLCRVSKSTRQRKTLNKLKIEKTKKTAKHFLKF
jgi:5-formaminoimidazole-4-carboxamide-1-beta-D-ribofuranosyl 5'-monophosphate synthetase